MKTRFSIIVLLAWLSLPLASQTVQKNADVAKDTLHVIGHSHMDMNWLWTLSETEKMAHDNLRQAVAFMEEFPDYHLLQSEAVVYKMVEEQDPELFSKVKKYVKEGRFEPVGGMWVESDQQMPSGEALTRSFLLGQRYFQSRFGRMARVGWLPDDFGHQSQLPQMLRQCGMNYFGLMRTAPHTGAFWWEGADGSRVLAFSTGSYNGDINEGLRDRLQAFPVDGHRSFCPTGEGDHGGGPTRLNIERTHELDARPDYPSVRFTTAEAFFKMAEKEALERPTHKGEMGYVFEGCYSNVAEIKEFNRKCENVLYVDEYLQSLNWMRGGKYPAEKLTKLWEGVAFNQFHDILPGSSIAEVYERARAELIQVRDEALRGAKEALSSFCREGDGLTVFNPSAHRVIRLLRTDSRFTKGAAGNGMRFPACRDGDGALVWACLEPLSAVTLVPEDVPAANPVTLQKQGDEYVFENSALRAVVNARGELISMVTLADGSERVRSASNVFHLYRDLPRRFDAWDLDSQTERREVSLHPVCEAEITCAGGLYAELKVTTRFSASAIAQRIRLTAEEAQLEFITEADWHETHRLLKVSFDTGIDADTAAHQIQFGYLRRPAHRSRHYDADRFEVCAHAWTALTDASRGAALLNDCKYGVSVNDGVIGLSLLRAPVYHDPGADRGRHCFIYAYRAWNGPLETSGVQEAADALNDPLITADGVCGPLRVLEMSSASIAVESVKLAEDGSGDLIIRLFESMGGARTAVCHPLVPFASARRCSLAEEDGEALSVSGDAFPLSFRPFEIVTVRLSK